jgi:tetratricopeptide (TPR) repeat protein
MPAAKKSSAGQPDDRLESWKEIAAYLNCSERTAKRWEKTRQLPVRRLPGGSGGVFAYRQEVTVWRDSEPALPEADIEAFDEASEGLPQASAYRSAGRSPLWFLGAILLLLSVAGAVHAVHGHRLMAAKVTGHIPSKEAQDLYLRGRFYWNKRTPPDLARAMSDFKAASALDPGYAEPYAGIADVYALAPQFASSPPAEAFPKMLEYARQALSLDPDLPEGHRALAFALLYWDWNRTESQKEFERAIELNPHDATTFHWYANALQQSENAAAALPLIEKARQLEPTDRSILSDRASILAYIGRNAEADEAWDAIEASEPTYLPPHWHRSEVAHHTGRVDVYLGELKAIAAITHSPDDLRRSRVCAEAYRSGGWKAAMLLRLASQKPVAVVGYPVFDGEFTTRFGGFVELLGGGHGRGRGAGLAAEAYNVVTLHGIAAIVVLRIAHVAADGFELQKRFRAQACALHQGRFEPGVKGQQPLPLVVRQRHYRHRQPVKKIILEVLRFGPWQKHFFRCFGETRFFLGRGGASELHGQAPSGADVLTVGPALASGSTLTASPALPIRALAWPRSSSTLAAIALW